MQEIYMLINVHLFIFSVNLLLQLSQLRTKKNGAKIIFPLHMCCVNVISADEIYGETTFGVNHDSCCLKN